MLAQNPPPGVPDPIPRFSRRTLALWLTVISLVILILPVVLTDRSIRQDVVQAEVDLTRVRIAQEGLAAPQVEVQLLTDELAQVQEEFAQVQSVLPEGNIDWPQVLTQINGYAPSQILLTKLAYAENRVQLLGQAVDEASVVAYVADLEDSDLFSRVTIGNLRALPPIPPTPTSDGLSTPNSPASPGLIPTPTPNLGLTDAYEIDDFQPQDLFLDAPQLHNFEPVYDVDRVQFLGKAGRTYRISTSELIPGVDTWLLVDLGSQVVDNDDREAGDLASEVVVQIPDGRDIQVSVTIRNRGSYGPDKWYQVQAQEIAPPAIPTQTPLPPATATSPPLLPTLTPTGTPNQRDIFEPDELTVPPISYGETQLHNFFPNGDLDRLSFLAKANRTYRVATSNLAQGVDTLLTVTVGNNTYTNDDRGPGDIQSEIIFQAPANGDSQALVTLSNRGQNGPQKWYEVSLEELVIPPTATLPAPTATPTATPSPTTTPTSTVTPTPTTTPRLQDAYEPDDLDPRPITVGESQRRNFYPQADLDRAFFRAQAGRTYRISTTDLSAGVDTVLVVAMGVLSDTNNDWEPGNLASQVTLQTPPEMDWKAEITVSNQGQDGPDQWYTLLVEEIIPAEGRTQSIPSPNQTQGQPARFKAPGLAYLQPNLYSPQPVGRFSGQSGPVGQQIQPRSQMTVEFELLIEVRVRQ